MIPLVSDQVLAPSNVEDMSFSGLDVPGVKMAERILIFTKNHDDAVLSSELLGKRNLQCHLCADTMELTDQISQGVGVVILGGEVLSPTVVHHLKKVLSQQARWSTLPMIIITKHDYSSAMELFQQHVASSFADCSLSLIYLERPVKISTLLSVVQGALNSRRQQYAIRDLIESLQDATSIAESASRAKSAFLANMSHEIRTPLHAILGFSSLMNDPQVTAIQRVEFMETITRNGKQLMQIIDDILDLTRVESEKMNFEMVPVSIPEILEDVSKVMTMAAGKKNIEFKVICEPTKEWDKSQKIMTDGNRLKQILMNIVGNAIKFTDRGHVSLTAKCLVGESPLQKISFVIEDTGRGISEEERSRLFKPFGQADISTTRQFGGTGLGLVLSKHLAHALGGDVVMTSSEPGKGSVFTVTISAPPVSGGSAAAESSLAGQKGALNGLKILVVDDQADNQALMRHILEFQGARVDQAFDGDAGLRSASTHVYDVIFMDMQMPIKGGIQATSELRHSGYALPIFAISAAAMPDERARALAAGCDDYITKPLTGKILLDKLLQYVK
jgi:signal transduction histidine kinase